MSEEIDRRGFFASLLGLVAAPKVLASAGGLGAGGSGMADMLAPVRIACRNTRIFTPIQQIGFATDTIPFVSAYGAHSVGLSTSFADHVLDFTIGQPPAPIPTPPGLTFDTSAEPYDIIEQEG